MARLTLQEILLKKPKYIRGNGCLLVSQRKPEIRFEQQKKVIKQIILPNYMG